MNKISKTIVLSAMIAATYATITYLCAILNFAYGPIQFRVSEALMILPVFTSAAIPGLTIGCVIANLTSPYGIIDIIFGSLATFITVYVTRLAAKRNHNTGLFLSPVFAAVFNALFVGAELAIFAPQNAMLSTFIYSAVSVGIGELTVCYLLGIPFYFILKKLKADKFLT